MNKNTIITLSIIFVIFIFWATLSNKKMVETKQPKQVNNITTGTMLVGSNALYVPEQKIGTSIVVSFVTLEKQGYVVVHEITEGKPGKIIGTSPLLQKGQSDNVSVPLTTTLVDGKNYIAMLHLDNGDNAFDSNSDTPAKNNDDGVMMEFKASVDAQTETNGVISL